MNLTGDVERFRELLFCKYDDQMGGLDSDQLKEFLQLELKLIQNQNLRELVEKRQKDARESGELSDYDCGMVYDVIQALLEDSKK